jgi:hypothetical protein
VRTKSERKVAIGGLPNEKNGLLVRFREGLVQVVLDRGGELQHVA